MSVDTETHLTAAATAYRTAKLEASHADAMHTGALQYANSITSALAHLEAELLAWSASLEEVAAREDATPEELSMAALRLQDARARYARAKTDQVRAGAALADADNGRLQARHVLADARLALYREAGSHA